MAEFEQAIKVVLAHEGSKIYADPETDEYSRFGISLRFMQGILPGAQRDDIIFNLTEDTAVMLYRRYFWNPCKFGEIEDQKLANAVFDMTVNMGGGGWHTGKDHLREFRDGGITLLQRAANQLTGVLRALSVDGVMGAKTIELVNKLTQDNPEMVLVTYLNHVRLRYQTIAAVNKAHEKDLRGWLNRAESLA